jgi:hypothetical protein
MTRNKVDLKMLSETLGKRCPFIIFALLSGLDENFQIKKRENPELCVFIDSKTGSWQALEQIFTVMASMAPEPICDVIVLNRVDGLTRHRAIQGLCLFIQEGQEQNYRLFVQRTNLDYKVMRAQWRRKGIIDNE